MTGRPLAPFGAQRARSRGAVQLGDPAEDGASLGIARPHRAACAAGEANQPVVAKLGVTPQTVGKWRARFVAQRLDGLHDEPRPGVPRSIDDAKVEAVIAATPETMQEDATRWNARAMASRSGISISSIQRIRRAFGLQPHHAETFKLSTDSLFVDQARDIVGFYMSPPNQVLVLCVDEKNQMKALDMTTCRVPGRCYRRHYAGETRRFLDTIDKPVPADVDIQLVLDNYATRMALAIKAWFVKRPRYHRHFTPTCASSLNQAERWFAFLTEHQIRRGVHRSVEELVEAVAAFIADQSAAPRPLHWTKTADVIR